MNTPTVWMKLKLPLVIASAFMLAAVWVLAGRLLFGVFGWMVFILLFTIVPVVVIYGIALAIVVAVRQRKYLFRPEGPFMIGLYMTLFGLFMIGLSVPDGGDAADSASSVLGVLLGERSNEAAIGSSGVVFGWALFLTTVSSIATFVLAFFERTGKPGAPSPVGDLKKSV